MKKIEVNLNSCIGCGACIATDPEHFDFNDDNYSEVISNDNLETSALQNAIETCPTNAIKMVDTCESCTCENCECN